MSQIVQEPPLSLLTTTKRPIDAMIDEVASLIGGAQDIEARNKSLKALDRAANWMNMSGIYLYQQKTKTYNAADVDTGATSLSLPSDWGWATDPVLVYDSNGDIDLQMEWLTWEAFARRRVDADFSDRPEWISIQSEAEGLLYIYPGFNTGLVSKIEIPYLARLQRPSEATDLVLFEETEEALMCGGEAFVMRHRHSRAPAVWGPMWKQFENAITNAKGAASRREEVVHLAAQPDEAGRLFPGVFSGNIFPRATVRIAF